jgi:phosphatidylserine decarboxylase
MKLPSVVGKFFLQEDINFVLTNRIPRRLATRFMGWFSKIEHPLIARWSIAVWRYLCDLDLSEARKRRFTSMHDCFVRELRAGARPIAQDAGVLVSPCDAILGAHGQVRETTVLQAKGLRYRIADLLLDRTAAEQFRDGSFATLRITAGMYHRFHAPDAGRVRSVTYISGDTFNVNPIAVRRIEALFCRNERALIPFELESDGHIVMLVPVAAILVAGIRLHFLDVLLNLKHRGPNHIPCSATLARGQEMGWFEHGSTIIVLAPRGFSLVPGLAEGCRLRVGQPLLRRP